MISITYDHSWDPAFAELRSCLASRQAADTMNQAIFPSYIQTFIRVAFLGVARQAVGEWAEQYVADWSQSIEAAVLTNQCPEDLVESLRTKLLETSSLSDLAKHL